MTTTVDLDTLLHRGVAEIIREEELRALLASGRPLRLKMGFDPTAPHVHLGWAVGLRKLRRFQEMGHKVILIVGDWTAQIGDPSGQTTTRRMLSREEVEANAQDYLRQFFRIVHSDLTEVFYQSTWYDPFSLEDVVKLTSRFTVAKLLSREDFANRFAQNRPITLTELIYPLLQAYDSVAVEADVEFGGTDQKFNCLAGRDLQEMLGQPAQQVFLWPLLPGPDGRKMSQSLGNYIGVADPPNDMYGKLMSITDAAMVDYYTLLTDVPITEIEAMQRRMAEGSLNPMDAKMRLARGIVGELHTSEAAQRAEAEFVRVFRQREAPEEMPEVRFVATRKESEVRFVATRKGSWSGVTPGQEPAIPRFPLFDVALPDGTKITDLADTSDGGYVVDVVGLLTAVKLAASKSEARRLINQRAVEVDGREVEGDKEVIRNGTIVRVGKRRFVRLVDVSASAQGGGNG